MALQPDEDAIDFVMSVTSITRNEAIYRLKVRFIFCVLRESVEDAGAEKVLTTGVFRIIIIMPTKRLESSLMMARVRRRRSVLILLGRRKEEGQC